MASGRVAVGEEFAAMRSVRCPVAAAAAVVFVSSACRRDAARCSPPRPRPREAAVALRHRQGAPTPRCPSGRRCNATPAEPDRPRRSSRRSRRCLPTSISRRRRMTVSDKNGRALPLADLVGARRLPTPTGTFTPSAGRRACTTRSSTTGRRCRMRCSSTRASPCTGPTPSAISAAPPRTAACASRPKNAKIFYDLVQQARHAADAGHRARQAAVLARRRRGTPRRYRAAAAFQPFGGFFAYEQPAVSAAREDGRAGATAAATAAPGSGVARRARQNGFQVGARREADVAEVGADAEAEPGADRRHDAPWPPFRKVMPTPPTK